MAQFPTVVLLAKSPLAGVSSGVVIVDYHTVICTCKGLTVSWKAQNIKIDHPELERWLSS